MITSLSPATARHYLALRLSQLRGRTQLTKQQAAHKIGRTGQTIANIEKGINAPSQSDLEKLLELYGATEHISMLRDLLPTARTRPQQRRAPIPDDYELLLNVEADMERIDIVETSLVPGLLQTRQYAEAVFRANPNHSDHDVQQLVATRMQRKDIFTRNDRPVALHAVIDESVLYRLRGDADVMHDQLDYLLEVARTPSVDLQVLPLDSGTHLGQGTSWSILTFPAPLQGHPGLVYLDLLGEALYRDDRESVSQYHRTWRHVLGAAASPNRSLQMIRDAKDRHRGQRPELR